MGYTYDQAKDIFEKHDKILLETEYKNIDTKMKYLCKFHMDKPPQMITLSTLNRGGGDCAYCKIEKGKSLGVRMPDDIVKDIVEKLDCQYVGRVFYKKNESDKIQFICNKHPEVGIQESLFSTAKKGCRICKICNGNGKTTEYFKEELFDINPNIEIIGEYTGARKRIKCRCKIDNHEWEPLAYNLLSGYGCPKCSRVGLGKSRGESYIYYLLNKWNIKFEIQKSFPDLIYNRPLYFDFYLSDSNVLIEYDGEYHFAPIVTYNTPQEDADIAYQKQCERDDLKNIYCEEKGIPLIRIPYWDYDDLAYILFDKLLEIGVIVN